MKIEYDKKVDALYIRIQEKKVSKTKGLEVGFLPFSGLYAFCIMYHSSYA
ncbi:MAG: DUF2283 domain-containing protein [Deltaproteobacteria bacterium]|nr:DUF2283 domain-containing protein [Deltaproteobacteria bacterium]MCL5792491.1 DUF2283 domain-containing protein [Deltaproteobacteria bacterium]